MGTCRAGPAGGSGGVSANSISRVMKVPIRLYNHISGAFNFFPLDLTVQSLTGGYTFRSRALPETLRFTMASQQEARCGHAGYGGQCGGRYEGHAAKGLLDLDIFAFLYASIAVCLHFHLHPISLPIVHLASSTPGIEPANTLDSIRDYARALLASLPPENGDANSDRGLSTPTVASNEDGTKRNGTGPLAENGNGAVHVDADVEPLHLNRPGALRRAESEKEKEDEGGLTGCREAVEILTRNPKKCEFSGQTFMTAS